MEVDSEPTLLNWEGTELGVERVSRTPQKIERSHRLFGDLRENFDMQKCLWTWPTCPTMRHRVECVYLSRVGSVMRSLISALFSLPALI